MKHLKHVSLALAVGFMALTTATGAYADWLAYSIDGQGRYGHGRAPTRAGAIATADNFCGRARCRLVAATQARCTALASSRYRGYWVGMGSASTKAGAMGYAIDWCSKNAPASTCRIAHTYCK